MPLNPNHPSIVEDRHLLETVLNGDWRLLVHGLLNLWHLLLIVDYKSLCVYKRVYSMLCALLALR